ncbi:MAG: hypothetical protein JXQ29_06840 [Planctomycetes bacterium]|nr:hypothetical protein [Planctomycetota bacterium]
MKKTAFLSLLLLAILITAAAADEIYVPADTPGSGSRNSWPFNLYPEWRYQLVIDAKFLGNQAFTVNEIAFAPSGTGVFTATQFEVRMGHSTVATSATFDTNIPNPTTVLSALSGYTWNTTDKTWSPIGLTSGFSYNGVDRLTIDIRILGGARTFSGTCYYDSGNHDRTWNNATGAWTATTGTVGVGSGLKVRLTVSSGAQLVVTGTGQIGTTVDLDLIAPPDGGKAYQLGTSLGTGPILIGTRQLDLSLDGLLMISVYGALPSVFKDYAGTLSLAGRATAKLVIPNETALKGITLYNAYVTLDGAAPQGVSLISPTVKVGIQ